MLVSLRIPRSHSSLIATVMGGIAPQRLEHWSEKRDGDTWVQVRVPNTKPALDRMLAVLDSLNRETMIGAMRAGVRIPSVYELHHTIGLKYKPEPAGREWWQTWIDNIEEREGDCEDLASHEASRQQLLGVNCRSECVRSAERVYHAIVRHADGSIQDPSLPLGLDEYRRKRQQERQRRNA